MKKTVRFKNSKVLKVQYDWYLKDVVGDDFQIVYADPPWWHYGNPNKNAAAGKHYRLMKDQEIIDLDIRSIMAFRSVLFCWVTCPRAFYQMSVISKTGLCYRGISHVWVKARKDGGIIHGQGVRPTFTKPTTELLTVWTTHRTGRTSKLLTEKQPQVILAPRGKHSEKPDIFRDSIVELLGDLRRIELFARKRVPGWEAWGEELDK